MIIASDNKKLAGAWVPGQALKLTRATDIAKMLRIPLVYVLNCSGVKLDEQEKVYAGRVTGGTPFYRHAELEQMGIPVLVGIYGTNPAGGGYHAVSPTILIAHEKANMLAQAAAESLNLKLIVWNIKSTTKAQDGLYVYDTVARLYDSQFGESGVNDIKKYIKLGKMGEAFQAEEQVVLLIDEIDKADLEFPNDLLWELDRMEFYIPETKETVRAKHRPFVIITSNAEKELPDAFLRRCIFHYIAFPDAPMGHS